MEEDPEKIINFARLEAPEASERCLACHRGTEMRHWQSSGHALNEIGCTTCHKIHDGGSYTPRREMQRCLGCHQDVAAEINLPSHHPVREGLIGCYDCHDPHGTSLDADLKGDERTNDLCLECHAALQGPFIFEHAPVVEDCSICHRPHGSVVNNLLTENEPFLCLQCHEFHFHAGARGAEGTSVGLRGEVLNNPNSTFGWKVAWTTKCTQCHVRIHGSDQPSQSLTGQGRALTR